MGFAVEKVLLDVARGIQVPPRAPRRSSLRTARERQSQKRLPFPHLCSVAPPFQIGSAALGSDLDSGSDFFRPAHHVRRTQLRSVSAVCERAAKTAQPLRPSSFPKRSSHGGAPFRLWGTVRIWIAPVHHVVADFVSFAAAFPFSKKRRLSFTSSLLLSKSKPHGRSKPR